MSAQDFLVELGTEELPPKALNTLADAFLAGIEKGLQTAGLKFAAKKVYAAPRRLAVLLTALETQQPDRSINLDGPPRQAAFDAEGNPTQAALGFAKKCGVELSEIDQSGPKLRFSQVITGKPTASLLPTIVEDSLNDLPIPKRMRWGARKEEFVRPTQWLVMLLGDQVIDCAILAQKAGRDSRGHRFHHPEAVRITSPANYAADLRAAYVLADANERRELISKRTEELARQQEGTAIVPPSLLDEVTALVEWPVPLVCSFEERFLDVPQDQTISHHHQQVGLQRSQFGLGVRVAQGWRLQHDNVVLKCKLLDRAGHQLLPTTGRAIGLGVDRHDFIRAGEQGLEVFGGEFGGAGKNDAQWLGHGKRLTKEKGLPEQAFERRESSLLAMLLFQLLLDPVAFKRGQVIDKQLAVEVVAFVLNAHRQQAFGNHLERLAVTVQGLDLDALGTVDVLVEVRYRQAAFLILAHLVGQGFELRVDKHQRLAAVFGQVHDHDALMHVDLGRGEADTRGFIHCFKHVIDQLTNLGVHYGHWLGDGAQA